MPKKRKAQIQKMPPGFQADLSIPPLRVVLASQPGNVVESEVAWAMRALGHQVLELAYKKSGMALRFEGKDADAGARIDRIMKFAPHFMLFINQDAVGFSGYFSGIAEAEGIPLVSWLTDVAGRNMVRAIPPQSAWSLIASYDESQLGTISEMGYANIMHLPLGTNFYVYGKDASRASSPYSLAYIGNLHENLVEENRRLLDAQLGDESASKLGFLQSLIKEGRQYLLDQSGPNETARGWLLKQRDGASDEERALLDKAIPFLSEMISHGASGENRKALALKLAGHGLHVWGKGWEKFLPKEQCHPSVPYERLPGLYGRAEIQLSISHFQNINSVTQRLFDVPACGGFVLSDWRPCVEDLFTEEEVAVFHSHEEALELVERFTREPEKRQAMSEKARRRVLSEHCYVHRIEALCRHMREIWPGVFNRPSSRRKQIHVESSGARAWPLLGAIASAMAEGGQDKGASILTEAMESAGQDGLLEKVKGDQALGKQNPAEALEHYEKYFKAGGEEDDAALISAARCLMALERFDEAESYCRKAIALNTYHTSYYTLLAASVLQQEKWADGRQALEKAFQLDPQNPVATNLATAFRRELDLGA
ncbi:MAG: glycosyltransferase [Candidatus Sumerlaeia bacterium]